MTRKTYTMTQADYNQISEQIKAAHSVSGMWLSGGMPRGNVQEAANAAWQELGGRMGFAAMTVKPGDGPLSFTAEPLVVQEKEP